MCGQLEKDISAFVQAAENGEVPYRLGTMERSDGNHFELNEHAGGRCAYAMRNLFDDAAPTSRIAMVFQNVGQHVHKGAWAAAARDFCDEKVAGVFVFEQNLAGGHADTFLDGIPQRILDADLPILFDEGGLSQRSPGSRILAYDEKLRFEDIEPLLDAGKLASVGGWGRGTFPIYDVTGTDAAASHIHNLARYVLKGSAEHCARILGEAGVWNVRWAETIDEESWAPHELMMLFLMLSLPDCLDPNTISFLGEAALPDEVPYAIGLDIASSSELAAAKKFGEDMIDVARLIAESFSKLHVRFSPTFPDNWQLCASELYQFLRATGTDSKLAALRAGVSLDDVTA
ncbi:MAG: hypothetical protein BZ138_07190 [Methanosphaera sp. rholeuAM270]|nr:MAG: hypothetical protein BZ138_07190 [Methanosphaera sp. rholeuAM270]